MVIREVLNFLKAREAPTEEPCPEAREEISEIAARTEALVGSTQQIANLISATDPTGLPLIYRDSQSMKNLNTTLEALQRSIERLGDRVERS